MVCLPRWHSLVRPLSATRRFSGASGEGEEGTVEMQLGPPASALPSGSRDLTGDMIKNQGWSETERATRLELR